MLIDGADKYSKRARYISELTTQWWNAWFAQCFPSLLPFKGWVQRQKNLESGDNVLVETKAKMGKNSYRMAQVVETHLDESGLCRRVTLEARP